MPSGGRRAHSGPLPDPDAIRRGARDTGPTEIADGWTRLPHAGRRKRAPAWPFPGEPDPYVMELWRKEWKRPQALMWERLGLELEVALYVLRVQQALDEPNKVNLGTLIRQQQLALGLSAPGLHLNRWIIEPPAPRATPQAAAPIAAGASSMRTRLAAVPDAPEGD